MPTGATTTSAPATRAGRELPNRSTIRPAARVARTSPTGAAISARPSAPSLSPRPALTAGIRAAQTPFRMPRAANSTATPTRARRIRAGACGAPRGPAAPWAVRGPMYRTLPGAGKPAPPAPGLDDLVDPAVRVGPVAELDPDQLVPQPHGDRPRGTVADREAAVRAADRADRGNHRGRAAREHLGDLAGRAAVAPLLDRDPALGSR